MTPRCEKRFFRGGNAGGRSALAVHFAPAILSIIGLVHVGGGASFAQETQPPFPTPPRPAARGRTARADTMQAEVERRYLHLQTIMTKLLQAISEAKEKGRVSTALDRSEDLKIRQRLQAIQRLLRQRNLSEALDEERIAEKDLARVLKILQGLDETEELREDAARLQEMKEQLERLEKLVDEQENIHDETNALEGEELSADDPQAAGRQDELAKKQQDLQRRTQSLGRQAQREEESAEREGAAQEESAQKDGENADASSESGEDGKADSESAQGKQGGKAQQGGKGQQGKRGSKGQQGKQGKQGQQSQQGKEGQQEQQAQSGEPGEQSQESQAGQQAQQGKKAQQSQRGQQSRARAARKSQALRRAAEDMQGSSERLDAGNLQGAMQDQKEALESLKQAREDLEEEVDDQEEENQDQAARLTAAKLQAMLAEQQLISAETLDLDARGRAPADAPNPSADPAASSESPAGATPAGPTPSSPDELRAGGRSLARRERSLGTDADEALKILETEPTSLVAPSILERVRDDLGSVAELLDAGQTGEVAQLVQKDVETSLRELIEAIKPRPKPQGLPQGAEPQEMNEQMMRKMRQHPLVQPITELKMLLSAQRRIRERTERLAAAGLPKPTATPDGGAEAAGAPKPKDTDLLAEQARRAAEAEQKLSKLTVTLMEKFPQIDELLLGTDNELDVLGLPSRDGDGEGKNGDAKGGDAKDTDKSEDPGHGEGNGKSDLEPKPGKPGPDSETPSGEAGKAGGPSQGSSAEDKNR